MSYLKEKYELSVSYAIVSMKHNVSVVGLMTLPLKLPYCCSFTSGIFTHQIDRLLGTSVYSEQPSRLPASQ